MQVEMDCLSLIGTSNQSINESCSQEERGRDTHTRERESESQRQRTSECVWLRDQVRGEGGQLEEREYSRRDEWMHSLTLDCVTGQTDESGRLSCLLQGKCHAETSLCQIMPTVQSHSVDSSPSLVREHRFTPILPFALLVACLAVLFSLSSPLCLPTDISSNMAATTLSNIVSHKQQEHAADAWDVRACMHGCWHRITL